ncbi:long-chain acyl-CoA synthetase [Hamadaea flava]|uniref:Acyl-CoA synthetase n=1 Tax=Hamadaea flava TaxID=1742688 RepID=A0ABV8LVM0_9ACTN|nr:AMP-dependent synthetase/ligase [Hamadaea flava]MCP2327870.1 long-chain acyl-CoA synthetase [Hamadaea flava]
MREMAVPAVVTIGDGDSLTDPVWSNADRHPEAVQFLLDDRQVTCAQFRDEVVALARGLIAAGVGPGDRVGLMSRTRYEWTLTDYAIWAVGGVTVPIYETSSPEQVRWILADSGAVACVTESAAHSETVREAAPLLTEVWQIDAGALTEVTTRGSAVEPGAVDERRAGIRADDTATIIYTSGTTGRPKGCVLSHRNMLADIGNAVPELSVLFHEGSTTLLFLPLAHAFARLLQIGAVSARVQTAFAPDVKNLVADLARVRPTFVLAVPRVFEKVYNSARQKAHGDGKGRIFDAAEATAIAYSRAMETGGPGLGLKLKHALFDRLVYGKLRAALGGRCTAAISGGAPLGERLGHFYRGIGLLVLEGYGLTETSPAITFNREGAQKIGTVGRPLPGVTVRIAEDGEILAKGDIIFREYFNNPAATAEAITDSWFHTGDLGELDDEGYLRITGRKKEILVTAGGKNVAPAVLEDRVRAHPLVSQCVVVGDQKPFIAALVTLDEESLPDWLAGQGRVAETLDDLRDDPAVRAAIQSAVDDANKAVSKAEAIRVFRILPRDFTEATGELTPSMKVKRAVVMKEYADEIDAIYLR